MIAPLTFGVRPRFCACVGAFLPVLFNRAIGWEIRSENGLSRGESRFPIIDFLRNRVLWLDGYISDRRLPRQFGNEHDHILIHDVDMLSEESPGFPAARKAQNIVDRHVLSPLHGVSDQLVADQSKHQRTLC